MGEKIARNNIYMKINVGCGKRKLRGYSNIDVDPQYNPDILGDIRDMDFKDLEVIRASHVLEHFDRKDGLEMLKKWHDWLKPGGILVVEVPDIERVCEFFSYRPEWIVSSIYGSQVSEWEYHKDGWYEEKMVKILKGLGFEILNIKKMLRRKNTPSFRVSARKLC